MELLASLLQELKAVCGGFPDLRGGRKGNIATADFGLSAFSLFFMQSESFLAHQRALEQGHSRSNCQTLFGDGTSSRPTTTSVTISILSIRAHLQPLFNRMEACLEKPAMKQAFQRLGGGFGRGVGRADADRLGRDGVFLFVQDQLSTLPDAPTQQRQDGTLPYVVVGDGRCSGDKPRRAADAGVHRQRGWCGETGLRTQCCQTLVWQTRNAGQKPEPGLSWRRFVRLSACGRNDRRKRR